MCCLSYWPLFSQLLSPAARRVAEVLRKTVYMLYTPSRHMTVNRYKGLEVNHVRERSREFSQGVQ